MTVVVAENYEVWKLVVFAVWRSIPSKIQCPTSLSHRFLAELDYTEPVLGDVGLDLDDVGLGQVVPD